MKDSAKHKKNCTGQFVRKLRMTGPKRMTQEQLAAACQLAGMDVSREIIAQIEGGTRKVSDFEVVILARVLEVPLIRLFGGRS
jgi:hypothetical protein